MKHIEIKSEGYTYRYDFEAMPQRYCLCLIFMKIATQLQIFWKIPQFK